jgi:DNA-binding Lrp family transcriptional regulator
MSLHQHSTCDTIERNGRGEEGEEMTTAIILVSTDPGKDQRVAQGLKKIKGVEDVCLVSGLYEVVATVRGRNSEEILKTVYHKIRRQAGVRDSHTMFCLKV